MDNNLMVTADLVQLGREGGKFSANAKIKTVRTKVKITKEYFEEMNAKHQDTGKLYLLCEEVKSKKVVNKEENV